MASTIEQAEQYSSELKPAVAGQEMNQAAEQLQAIAGTNSGGIGVIGFSLGGYLAIGFANQESSPFVATVVFYATRNDGYAASHSAFQFHLAETDQYEPPSEVEKLQTGLRAAGTAAELYTYPGTTHWSFESNRTDAYHAESARLAWNRTIEFLKAHIQEA